MDRVPSSAAAHCNAMKSSARQSALKKANRIGQQYAALPYRWVDGELEILLLTSRETHRWVIPKGWPMAGRKPHAAAAQEALEEAGVIGKIGKTPVGAYTYVKRLKNGAGLVCNVDVFPLAVARQLKRWREQGQRTAHWFTPTEAAEAVNEPELDVLIEAFGANPPQRSTKPPRVAATAPAEAVQGSLAEERDEAETMIPLVPANAGTQIS
jgi:8-oxo-dGTP pyrophosphatase MutT (NUDIX family)